MSKMTDAEVQTTNQWMSQKLNSNETYAQGLSKAISVISEEVTHIECLIAGLHGKKEFDYAEDLDRATKVHALAAQEQILRSVSSQIIRLLRAHKEKVKV